MIPAGTVYFSGMQLSVEKDVIKDFFKLSTKFKNSGFVNENEIRIVIYPESDDNPVRVSNLGITQYTEVKLKDQIFHKLWIGPAENKLLAKSSAVSAFRRYKKMFISTGEKDHEGKPKYEMQMSEISYR